MVSIPHCPLILTTRSDYVLNNQDEELWPFMFKFWCHRDMCLLLASRGITSLRWLVRQCVLSNTLMYSPIPYIGGCFLGFSFSISFWIPIYCLYHYGVSPLPSMVLMVLLVVGNGNSLRHHHWSSLFWLGYFPFIIETYCFIGVVLFLLSYLMFSASEDCSCHYCL